MPNPDRIDFAELPDGRINVIKMTRDRAYRRDIPTDHAIHEDLDFDEALDWLRENGYTVRCWPGGARAWKGTPWIIRTRREIWQKRQQAEAAALADLNRNPGKWHDSETRLQLDFAYEG
jgi:hypothetical protein